MLENATGTQLQLSAPLSGEVARVNEALLQHAPPPAAPGQPLWLLDIDAPDEDEWIDLPPAGGP